MAGDVGLGCGAWRGARHQHAGKLAASCTLVPPTGPAGTVRRSVGVGERRRPRLRHGGGTAPVEDRGSVGARRRPRHGGSHPVAATRRTARACGGILCDRRGRGPEPCCGAPAAPRGAPCGTPRSVAAVSAISGPPRASVVGGGRGAAAAAAAGLAVLAAAARRPRDADRARPLARG